MSMPNSHTKIFTTIPSSIRKTWSAAPVVARDGRSTDNRGIKHEHSLIDTIKVEIDFNRSLQEGFSLLSEFDESEGDAIAAWQEARRSWASLERAIADVVDSMVNMSRERAAQNGMQTVDVLRVQRTDAERPTECPSPEEEHASASRRVSFKEPLSDAASSIVPDDSASVVTITQSTLEDMMARLGKQKHKTRGKAPNSVLSYVAGVPRRKI